MGTLRPGGDWAWAASSGAAPPGELGDLLYGFQLFGLMLITVGAVLLGASLYHLARALWFRHHKRRKRPCATGSGSSSS